MSGFAKRAPRLSTQMKRRIPRTLKVQRWLLRNSKREVVQKIDHVIRLRMPYIINTRAVRIELGRPQPMYLGTNMIHQITIRDIRVHRSLRGKGFLTHIVRHLLQKVGAVQLEQVFIRFNCVFFVFSSHLPFLPN